MIGLLISLVGWNLSYALITIENVRIQQVGVSISDLKLNVNSLAVGQSISASYQFNSFYSNNSTDASVYLWGVKGSTASRVDSNGIKISKTGEVPDRILVVGDIGTVLEVSVQARNSANQKGNILTTAIDSLSLAQGDVVYDGSITPIVSNLVLTGTLSVNQTLNATYHFNAGGGNNLDKTTYHWGNKNNTASNVRSGSSVQVSGQIPGYIIQASDIGQVLELSIEAKNAAVPVKTGNTLTMAVDGTGTGTNNTTGGGVGGTVINPMGSPIVSNLNLVGTIQINRTLNATYTFDPNKGDPTDKTTFKWGIQGETVATVGAGQSVTTSGVVPPYTIQAGDAGKTLEVSIQAKNNAAISGNILTAVATEAVPLPLALTGSIQSVTVGQTSVDLTVVNASGGKAPYTYSISPSLGNGLTLNTTTGHLTAATISGLAAAAADYTVTVTDANSATAAATVNLTIVGAAPAPMQLTSTAFTNGTSIPVKYTCNGTDISPPLSWSNIPSGTQSLVLIVDDPDAPDPSNPPTITWVHWVLYNIPFSATVLSEGVINLPTNTLEGLNDWGNPVYGGPCPPAGEHRYYFKLYALDKVLSLSINPTKADVENAMQGHILGQATLMGRYKQ